mgnify:CR=1 FL=1
MQRSDPRRTWNDAIADVLERELDRDDEIEASLDGLEVDIPIACGEDAPRMPWRFDGQVTVRVEGEGRPLADWLRFWARRSGDER